MKEEFKQVIREVLLSESKVNWLIVHKVYACLLANENFEFHFVDGVESDDEPFEIRQGYFGLRNSDLNIQLGRTVKEILSEFTTDSHSIANLFILTTRINTRGNEKEILIEEFKEKLGPALSQIAFDLLVKALNSEYYKNNYLNKEEPVTTNQWLDIFRFSEYLHSLSDILLECLMLVRTGESLSLAYSQIEGMKPLIRSKLIGWYGFNLQISESDLSRILGNEVELSFLSACLLDAKKEPDWLTQELIAIMINQNWHAIGKQVFVHVFGISHRNKGQGKKLEDFIHDIILRKLSEDSPDIEWIRQLEFPDDFIAFFYWVSIRKVEITEKNRSLLCTQFIRELKRINSTLLVHLASDNSSDPFKSYQMYEEKYQRLFPYLLLILLYASDEDRKDLLDTCHDFKPLFYGGFRAQNLASQFADLLIVIGLSGMSLKDVEEIGYSAIEKYLKVLSDTIVIPYIHLSERKDEVWDPDRSRTVFQYNYGSQLVRNSFNEIYTKLDNYPCYRAFFNKVSRIAIAKWY